MTTPRRSPAYPLTLALVLALALASCGRPGAHGSAGSRTAAAAEATRDPAPSADARDSVALYPAAELARMAAALGHGSTGRTLGAAPTFSYIQGRRTATGEPERHERWTDVAYVQAGRAAVLTGGSMRGGRQVSPGEERGGTIVGGTSRPIAAGDLLVIPAGIPHQYRLALGQTLTYLTIKVPAAH